MIASHYAEPLQRRLGDCAALMSEPSAGSTRLAELQPGDEIRILDVRGGWAWGYGPDGRVGYVPEGALAR